MPEMKKCRDMITDGILAWGVDVGRFIFEEAKTVVYAVTDTPHCGPSDVEVDYQISKEDYLKLKSMSRPHGIPDPPVPKEVVDACRARFLCSQSAYADRYEFTLEHVDMNLVERIEDAQAADGE